MKQAGLVTSSTRWRISHAPKRTSNTPLRFTFQEGLRITVDWYRQNFANFVFSLWPSQRPHSTSLDGHPEHHLPHGID